MIEINYIYKFINDSDEIIYVGKTNNINYRMNNHTHLSIDAYNEVSKIYYTTCNSVSDQHITEIILINYYKPKYNQQDKKDDQLTSELFESIVTSLEWEEYNDTITLPINSKYKTRNISVRKIGLDTFKNKEMSSSDWSALGFYWYLLDRSNQVNNKVCFNNINQTSLTNEDMIKETGISESTLKKYIRTLEDMDLIIRDGRGTGRNIYINDKYVQLK